MASSFTVLDVRRDDSAVTSFAHAPYVQQAGNTNHYVYNACARCAAIPKRDGHTYIHTDAKRRDAKQD